MFQCDWDVFRVGIALSLYCESRYPGVIEVTHIIPGAWLDATKERGPSDGRLRKGRQSRVASLPGVRSDHFVG